MDPFVSLPGGTRGRESIINCATPLRGWRALHKRQATAKTKRWAILLGKSWVVLPNFSAILSKISEMPDMPVVTSSSAASGAGWGCSLTRPEVQQHSLFSNPSKARCLQPFPALLPLQTFQKPPYQLLMGLLQLQHAA